MADVTTGRAKVSLVSTPGPNNPQGPAPQGLQARNSTSLTETRSLASFPVSVPGYTAGFGFLQAGVLQKPRQAVVITFAADDKRTGFQIFQAPATQYQTGAAGQPTYFVVADNLTEVPVGTGVGARSLLPANPGGIATTSLVWEKGDLLYHLIGLGLSDQEITRIATSV
jgi:hypothetical protein